MQITEANNFLKRGKGKTSGNIKKKQFYKYYSKNCRERQVTEKVYNAFLKDLICKFSELIVTEALELKVPHLGKFRIRSKKLNFFKKDGTFCKTLRPNWKATWESWYVKYPGLTRDEIVEIKNKKVVYHDNEHTENEFYEHYWDKITSNIKYKTFYNFEPSRQYSRLIAKVVKDPNRKVFYYG